MKSGTKCLALLMVGLVPLVGCGTLPLGTSEFEVGEVAYLPAGSPAGALSGAAGDLAIRGTARGGLFLSLNSDFTDLYDAAQFVFGGGVVGSIPGYDNLFWMANLDLLLFATYKESETISGMTFKVESTWTTVDLQATVCYRWDTASPLFVGGGLNFATNSMDMKMSSPLTGSISESDSALEMGVHGIFGYEKDKLLAGVILRLVPDVEGLTIFGGAVF